MKKNLLAIATMLGVFAGIFFLGLAAIDGLTAYEVWTKGMFHGVEYEIPTTLYQGAAALAAGAISFFSAFRFARLAVRHQHEDQHPKSTIRSK